MVSTSNAPQHSIFGPLSNPCENSFLTEFSKVKVHQVKNHTEQCMNIPDLPTIFLFISSQKICWFDILKYLWINIPSLNKHCLWYSKLILQPSDCREPIVHKKIDCQLVILVCFGLFCIQLVFVFVCKASVCTQQDTEYICNHMKQPTRLSRHHQQGIWLVSTQNF